MLTGLNGSSTVKLSPNETLTLQGFQRVRFTNSGLFYKSRSVPVSVGAGEIAPQRLECNLPVPLPHAEGCAK